MKKRWFIPLCVITFILSGYMANKVKQMIFPSPWETYLQMPWEDSMGEIYTDLPYGEGKAEKFDLYLPSVKQPKKSYGLVVYLHAGGFVGGDKSEDALILKSFCRRGYVAAGINYTLTSKENPKSNVYTQSLDIKKAMPEVVKKAAEKGYPINGVIMSGGSAGACLAMIYAFRDADESPVPVKAIISMVGPATFEPKAWMGKMASIDYNDSTTAAGAAAWVASMTGDSISPRMMASGEYQRSLAKISAASLVNERSVPLVAAYGMKDKLVPYETVHYLTDSLDKYHVTYDCFVLPHSGHALHRDREIMTAFCKKMEEYLAKYLPIE